MTGIEFARRYEAKLQESREDETAAKKIRAGLYAYRGLTVEKVVPVDEDEEWCRGLWRITKEDGYFTEQWDSHFDTFAEAKAAIDEEAERAAFEAADAKIGSGRP